MRRTESSFIHSFIQVMNWNLLIVGKVLSYEQAKYNGIILSVEHGKEKFHLMDDEINRGLLSRFEINPNSVQTIEEAAKIIEEAKNSYIAVYNALVSGFPFYSVFSSDVPGYVYTAYYDPATTSAEKNVILNLVKNFQFEPNLFERANGKYIVIVNGKLLKRFFNSFGEAQSSAPATERHLLLRINPYPIVNRGMMSSCFQYQ